MSRDSLISQLNDGFETLLASVEGLTDEQVSRKWYGDWGVRELLAHVSGWHREMAAAFERIARGERPIPEGVDYSDSDAQNAGFVSRAGATTAAEAIGELKASKAAFVAAALPEDRFEEGRAAYRILTGTGADHYKEHEATIREWREREGI